MNIDQLQDTKTSHPRTNDAPTQHKMGHSTRLYRRGRCQLIIIIYATASARYHSLSELWRFFAHALGHFAVVIWTSWSRTTMRSSSTAFLCTERPLGSEEHRWLETQNVRSSLLLSLQLSLHPPFYIAPLDFHSICLSCRVDHLEATVLGVASQRPLQVLQEHLAHGHAQKRNLGLPKVRLRRIDQQHSGKRSSLG